MGIRESRRPPVALIAGPTASGKSALALALAERSGGVLVNADSAQIYRDLNILSARPSEADLARADHRLYGSVDGADPCSAAHWAAMARREIGNIHAIGRLPILVGGTGLYLRTLLDGIAPVPAIDPEVRRAVREAGVDANYRQLKSADPDAAARLKPSDTTRVARALEVKLSTGRALANWQGARDGGIGGHVELRPLILLPPRPWLQERCDARFTAMLDGGAIDEVRALLARQLDPKLPAMRAIGVREIGDYIRGTTDRETAITLGQQATRQYAKRQYTWFRHQPPPDWPRREQVLERHDYPAALELLGAKA